ncbi:MAG: GyrI-like domain-containing protein [Candidatus Firestonebacteria bacterium]
MEKYDYKKKLKYLYDASADKIGIIDIPPMNYLMIDGKGNPNKVPSFKEAVGTLYSISYNLKFTIKKEKNIDYKVMPLEGLWWMEDMNSFNPNTKDEWKWTIMIIQPDFIKKENAIKAIDYVKRKSGFNGFPKVRFEKLEEGKCAQILYIGPYENEESTIKNMHKFVLENGYSLYGKHHEIYLSDPRKCAPEKLRTIIRQPIIKS